MELLFASETRALAQDLLLYGLSALTLVWGATPERMAIGIWWLCFELPKLVFLDWFGYQISLTNIDPYLATKDIAAAIFWTALALYANRNYTLWIAGIQLVAVGSHLARGIVEAIAPIAYVFLVIVPGWMQLLVMAIGLARHVLRKRQFGSYRDWRIVRGPTGLPPMRPGGLA